MFKLYDGQQFVEHYIYFFFFFVHTKPIIKMYSLNQEKLEEDMINWQILDRRKIRKLVCL